MKRGISQSGICLYRFCPYAYKLKYVDRCKPMFYDSSAMDTGSYVHKSIDHYYSNGFSMEKTSNEILYDTYSKLKEIWDITLEPLWLKKAYECLINHSDWEYQNIKKGITKPFSELKVDSGKYFGYIDYINLQKALVIDWKTGKYPSVSFDYRIQAYVYKDLFENEFNTNLKSFYFFFLHPNKWRKISYDKDKQILAGKECERLLGDILDEKFPKEPRLKNSCRYCDYKYYCKILEEPYQSKNEMFKNVNDDSDMRKLDEY